MGVLNITPDSFSDAGKHFSLGKAHIASALSRAQIMIDEGATFIDVGGESTRPNAETVSLQEELDRVIPVIEGLVPAMRQSEKIISIDTSKPEVMREAVGAGAGLINDVRAFRLEGAFKAAASTGVPLCIMHMQNEPRTMQSNPSYIDVVEEVSAFFNSRTNAALSAGVSRDNILLDPGFGFGKTLEHNLQLLSSLKKFVELGMPILVGMSKKSMIGAILNKPVDERLYGGLGLAAIAVEKGASIVRTHDVKETVDAVKVAHAVFAAGI